MLRRKRLFMSALAVPLITACAFLLSPTSIATTTPPGISTTFPTFTPSAASLPTNSPLPTDTTPPFPSFKPVTRVSLTDSERVLNMVAESDGTIWLLTNHRVMQYSRNIWADYLSSFNGTLLGMDSRHHIWIVSDDRTQASFWNGSAWMDLGLESDWKPPTPDNSMNLDWSFTTDAQGRVWLSTNQDIRMFDGTNWKIFNLDDLGMPRPELEDAYTETIITFLKTSGYVWALNCHWIGPGPIGGGGVRWYDGQAWKGANSPVANGCATVINEDDPGNIWLGLDNELWRLDASKENWKQFQTPEPPQGGWFGLFSDLPLDTMGNPWPELVVCGGASCYTGNIRYHITGTEWIQIGDNGIDNSTLFFDPDGQGWVFTSYGVSRIEENRLEPVAELSILRVARTPSGSLWVLGAYKGETVLWAQVPDN